MVLISLIDNDRKGAGFIFGVPNELVINLTRSSQYGTGSNEFRLRWLDMEANPILKLFGSGFLANPIRTVAHHPSVPL